MFPCVIPGRNGAISSQDKTVNLWEATRDGNLGEAKGTQSLAASRLYLGGWRFVGAQAPEDRVGWSTSRCAR